MRLNYCYESVAGVATRYAVATSRSDHVHSWEKLKLLIIYRSFKTYHGLQVTSLMTNSVKYALKSSKTMFLNVYNMSSFCHQLRPFGSRKLWHGNIILVLFQTLPFAPP